MSTATPSNTTWDKVAYYGPRILLGVAIAAFVGYLIVYFIYALALFQYPFDYDQGEGFELMDTILFSEGRWPYRDNNHYPFYSSNYPPLFHVIIVPLVWLFGPQYWTGRLVSFVGTLITAVFIGYGVQREGKRWWLSLVAGLAFLASNYVYHVGPLFRQHMFMVMFETIAVVFLTMTYDKEEENGRFFNKRILVVMLLLLAAGYTKQLAYATVAAVFLFMFLRKPIRAIKWAIPFAIVTGLIFLWINVSTDGYWYLNTVTANINPFVPGQAEGLFRQWFTLHTVITVAALIYAAYQLYFERLSAYTVWFVVAVVNSVTSGKWGAGESYFATAIAASCILTGLLFSRLVNWAEANNGQETVTFHLNNATKTCKNVLGKWLSPVLLTLIAVLLLVQANKVFHMPTHTPTLRTIASVLGKPTEVYIAPQTSCSAPRDPEAIPYVDSAGVSLLGRPPSPEDTAAGEQITALVRAGITPAFSEEAGFNLRAGRDVVTNPTQLLNLYNNNEVDLSEMGLMLANQQFSTIVLRAQFYPPPILNTIGQRYETTDLIQMNGFVYCVMHPKAN
mgnify:CR=1 FL=1